MTKRIRHPIQPVVTDKHKVRRFKRNSLIRSMLECGKRGTKFDLNDLRTDAFNNERMEDYFQLLQLLGYSIDGILEYDDIPKDMRKEFEKLL